MLNYFSDSLPMVPRSDPEGKLEHAQNTSENWRAQLNALAISHCCHLQVKFL
jgi:hypothetical protein